MSTYEEELKAFEHTVFQYRAVMTAQVAGVAWVCYDIVLTFSQELEVVWRRKWSLAKVFYLVSRYYISLNLILSVAISTYDTKALSASVCNAWIRFYSTAPLIAPLAVDGLLVIRLYALYNHNRILLAFLLILYIGEAGAMASSVALILRSVTLLPLPVGLPLPGCHPLINADLTRSVEGWVVTLTAQFVFFSLTMYKFIQSAKVIEGIEGQNKSIFSTIRRTRNIMPLISLFTRDGTLAFFLLFAVVLISCLLTLLGPSEVSPIQLMGTPWLEAVDVIVASRLYLNLGGYMHRTPAIPAISIGDISSWSAEDDRADSITSKDEPETPTSSANMAQFNSPKLSFHSGIEVVDVPAYSLRPASVSTTW